MNGRRRLIHGLEVDALLQISNDDARVFIDGSGTTLVASAADSRSLRELIRGAPHSRGRRRAAGRLHFTLRDCGLTLDLRLGNRRIARLGSGAKPTLPGRLAGIPAAEMGWGGLGLCLRALAGGWLGGHGQA